MIGKTVSHLPREINENSCNFETAFGDYRIFSKLLYNTCISQGKQNQQLQIIGQDLKKGSKVPEINTHRGYRNTIFIETIFFKVFNIFPFDMFHFDVAESFLHVVLEHKECPAITIVCTLGDQSSFD